MPGGKGKKGDGKDKHTDQEKIRLTLRPIDSTGQEAI